MKHIYRKPMLPGVLLALLVFGLCFMTLFQQSIRNNQAAVDEMYDSVQLKFQILPGISANGVLQLRNKTVTKIKNVEEIKDCLYYLECLYSLREPIQAANFSVVYGTNDLTFFSEERGIHITYGEGWDEKSVLTLDEDGAIPCLLESNLADLLRIEPGDTLVVAPNLDVDTDPESAPSLTLTVAGTYTNQAGLVELFSIVVPDGSFINNPGFLYNGNMMENFYYYRTFHFQTDSSYNRNFQPIKEEITSILKKDGDFILYCNARILEQAVRPIEQKIRIQQMLVTPLSLLLCIATSVMTLLLCTGFSSEVFLRLLWGEKRWAVWLHMMGSLILLLTLEGTVALIIVCFVSGTQWLTWATQYLFLTMGMCIMVTAIQQTIFCSKNLVAFYQSKEE